MENLGKKAQKELMAQIDAIIEELQSHEHYINRYFEYIQKAVTKRRKIIEEKATIEWRNEHLIYRLKQIDREIVKLYSWDNENKMVPYYLQLMSEWVDTLNELDPKIKTIAEKSIMTYILKKKKTEVILVPFTSKTLHIIQIL